MRGAPPLNKCKYWLIFNYNKVFFLNFVELFEPIYEIKKKKGIFEFVNAKLVIIKLSYSNARNWLIL